MELLAPDLEVAAEIDSEENVRRFLVVLLKAKIAHFEAIIGFDALNLRDRKLSVFQELSCCRISLPQFQLRRILRFVVGDAAARVEWLIQSDGELDRFQGIVGHYHAAPIKRRRAFRKRTRGKWNTPVIFTRQKHVNRLAVQLRLGPEIKSQKKQCDESG